MISLILLVSVTSILARTWYIAPDGTGDAPTIRDGVGAAGVHDTVLVACGTYYEHSIFIAHEIALLSETGEADCVAIDAQQQGCVIEIGACVDSRAIVKGFTIRGASCLRGGGVRLHLYASPRLVNLVLEDNTALDGAGIWVDETGYATLENITFAGNHAEGNGGGLYVYGGGFPRLTGCRFLGNTAEYDGGGAYIYEAAAANVSDCCFSLNEAGRDGSAMWCDQNSLLIVAGTTFDHNVGVAVTLNAASVDMSDCIFLGNTGTALKLLNASPSLSGCCFRSNAGGWGGAMVIMGDFPAIENTVFSGNSGTYGGAIYIDSGRPEIRNCTFVGNSGGQGSSISVVRDAFDPGPIENSILAYGYGGPAVYCWGSGSNPDPSLSCCNIYGNEGGDLVGCIAEQFEVNGNFSACPSFCDVDAADFQLCDESPCAPGNHPYGHGCGLIGAFEVGCSCGPTQTEGSTWGSIKSMYR
jgi:parallel beta-helix repeat protein/predicted outer membrane repeat protein